MYAVTVWMVQPFTCEIVGTKMEQNNLNLKQSKTNETKQTNEQFKKYAAAKKKRVAYEALILKRYEKALFIMSKIENNKRKGIVDKRDNKCRNKCKKAIENYLCYTQTKVMENSFQQDSNNKEHLQKGSLESQVNKGKEIVIKQLAVKQELRDKTSAFAQSNLAKEKPNEKLDTGAKQIGISQLKCANIKPQEKQQIVTATQGIKAGTSQPNFSKEKLQDKQVIRSITTKEKSQELLEKVPKQTKTTQPNLTKENPQEKQEIADKQTNISQLNTSTSCLSTDDPITNDLCMALASVSANGGLQPVIEEWPKIELKMSDILMHYLLHNRDCPIPRYNSGEIYQGFLLIQCQDTFSKDFLNNCINKVREDFKDLKLTIIPASEISLTNTNIINTQPSYLESQEEEDSDLEPPPPPAWSNDSNEETKTVKTKNPELSYQHALLRLDKFKQRERINPRYRRKIKKCLHKIKNYELRKYLQANSEDAANKQAQEEGFQLSVNYFEEDLEQQQEQQQTKDDFKQQQPTEGFQLSINYFETDLEINKDKKQLLQQPTIAKEINKESWELNANNFNSLPAETESFREECTTLNPFKDNNFNNSLNTPSALEGGIEENNRTENSTRSKEKKREENYKRRLRYLRKLSQLKELTPREMKYKIENEKFVRKYEEYMAKQKQLESQTSQDSQKYLQHKQSPGDYVVSQEEMLEFLQNSGNFEENKACESEFPSTSNSNMRTNSLGILNDDFERRNLSTNPYNSQAPTCSKVSQTFMRNKAEILTEFPLTTSSNMEANSLKNLNDPNRESFHEMRGISRGNNFNSAVKTTEFSQFSRRNMEDNCPRNFRDPYREIDNKMTGYSGTNNFNPADQTFTEFPQTARRNMLANKSERINFNEMPGYSIANNFPTAGQTFPKFPQIAQRNMETNNSLNFLQSSRRSQTITKPPRQPNEAPKNSNNLASEVVKSELEKRILECLNNLNEEMLEDQPKTCNLEQTIQVKKPFTGAQDYNHQFNSVSSSLKRKSQEYQLDKYQESRTNIELQGCSSSLLKHKSECPVEEVITLSDDSENSDIEEVLKKSENLRKDRLEYFKAFNYLKSLKSRDKQTLTDQEKRLIELNENTIRKYKNILSFKEKRSKIKLPKPILVNTEKKTRWNSPETSYQNPQQQQGFWSSGSGTIYQNINPNSYTATSSSLENISSTSSSQNITQPAAHYSYPSIKSNPDLQIAIIDRNEPDFKIRAQCWQKLQQDLRESLLREIQQTNNSNIGLFDAMYWRYGIKIVQCENKESLEFIKRFIHNQELYWPGTEFDVIPVKDLPKRSIVKVWIPPPLIDDNGVLKLLKAQNSKFYSLDWTLINSREKNNKNGKDLYISISATSLERLRKKQGEIRYGINTVKMILPPEEGGE